jgi:protein TonB
MFDTSIVRTSPRRIMLLTTSIAIHSVAVIAAIALSVASTQLPPQPPRQLEIYRAFDPPAAPPPPLGKPAAARHEATAAPRAKPAVQTAPAVVPDQTPALSEPAATTTAPIGNDTGPIGSDIGVDNSVGSDESAISTGPSTSTAPYFPGRDVTSARVISRVEPRFPRELIHGVRSALVVVRCIIGSNGQIRDPEIITSSFPPFNDAVIVALRQWKFAPGTLRGQPVETWFELTVRFQVR